MDAPAGPPAEPRPASRGYHKLRHALTEFKVDPSDLVCADLGCSTGGFTDCLLRAGASRVFSVDTAYGQLDYRLRVDPRVTVLERTNALHASPPADAPPIDLVCIDMGWTPQRLAVPAALRWLRDDEHPDARIITLIKPHYELTEEEKAEELVEGVLDEDLAEAVTARVLDSMESLGAVPLGVTKSPILGGETRGKKKGNAEWLALLARM